MTYAESKLPLYRIVGAIFTDMPPPPAGGGEATPVEAAPELTRIAVAYRVIVQQVSKSQLRRLLEDRLVQREICPQLLQRSEEHTSELQSLMRNSYALFCLKQKQTHS